MTPEQVRDALLALNEARQKTIKQPVPPDWVDEQARVAQWQRIHDLDARADEIEKAWPLFRVWYDAHVYPASYVLVPRAGSNE